jgi:hypothetical protein
LSSSPPNRRWPPPRSPARSRRGSRRGRPPATRSTAPTRHCAPRSRPSAWVTCWSSAVPPRPHARRVDAPRPDRRRITQELLAAVLGRGRREGPRIYDWAFIALIDTEGPGRRWLLMRRHPRTRELASTAATPPPRSRSPSWSASPAPAGPSRKPSRAARA